VPVVAMLVGPAYVELVHRRRAAGRLPGGSGGSDTARQHPRDAGPVRDKWAESSRTHRRARGPRLVDRTADVISCRARRCGGSRPDVHATRANPALTTISTVRPRAAPPGHRARRVEPPGRGRRRLTLAAGRCGGGRRAMLRTCATSMSGASPATGTPSAAR
jgi:hypothetical protein